VVRITGEGETIGPDIPVLDEALLKQKLVRSNQVRHPSIMFRSENGYRYRDKFVYAQDYDMLLRLLSEGRRIVNLPHALIKYRITNDSISYSIRAKQELFCRAAREFYLQRLTAGRDKYDEFDPRQILDVNVDEIEDCYILGCEIEACFRTGLSGRVRKTYKRYFNICRRIDKYLLYYFASFLPGGFVNILRRTAWKLKIPIRMGTD
jgi:hypothetical protein